MNQVANTTNKGLDLSPQTFEQAMTFSQYLADSDMVPKDYRGKPGNCLIAMQWGAEVGLKPLQALQNIAVINGRPSLWGDSVLAIVLASPLCEYVKESDDGSTATCRVKRRGEEEAEFTFSMDDARTAGLLSKPGPWTQYPKRMRKMRARAFALRDKFADVLRGMAIAEEAMDAPEKPMGMVDVVQPSPAPAPAPQAIAQAAPSWPDDAFAAQLPRWTKAIEQGLKTTTDILTLAKSKGALSAEQEAAIRRVKPIPAQPEPEDDTAGFVADMDAAEGSEG